MGFVAKALRRCHPAAVDDPRTGVSQATRDQRDAGRREPGASCHLPCSQLGLACGESPWRVPCHRLRGGSPGPAARAGLGSVLLSSAPALPPLSRPALHSAQRPPQATRSHLLSDEQGPRGPSAATRHGLTAPLRGQWPPGCAPFRLSQDTGWTPPWAVASSTVDVTAGSYVDLCRDVVPGSAHLLALASAR